MQRRTIIMLSAKRCGSTAIFRMFQKHPEVGVCHVDQHMKNWEPNFWNLGAKAVDGCPEKFLSRFGESHPFLHFPEKFTEESLFRLWDDILEELGPVVFDKSPQYLGDKRAFALLKRYMDKDNDVRLFALIRDPRDAITSQYERWKGLVEDDSPKRREMDWLEKYRHLEELQRELAGIPLFQYEDFSSAPSCYAPILLRHCGCSVVPQSYDHIKPTSIGRYSASILPAIRRWRFDEEFKRHLENYGYRSPQLSFSERVNVTVRLLKGNLKREMRSMRRGKRSLKNQSPPG